MIRWEAHTCLPLHPDASFEPLERYRAAGVHHVCINVGMDMNPLSQILPVLAAFRARLRAEPARYLIPCTVADIEHARNTGKLAVGFDLEGALPLLERPEMVALYRDLGVRQIHFAYNRNNSVAGGCHDEPHGLTALGRRMVQAVNGAGVLMDCAHTERRTTLDIMAHSRHPVVFSHANPLALAEHGRNITDEQIRACAATGGVVCISGVSKFLGSEAPQASDLARHVAYVADLVGAQHVGLGLDIGFSQAGLNDDPPGAFDPGFWWPAHAGYGQGISQMRYAPIESWQTLPDALRATGMGPQEVNGVLGDNMARVARQVWGTAAD
ncbi:MAG: peptidase M19 [Betaproteobacteria bacterium HGW-Betaproteobacteria-9]|jgi:membrane dipeptidase|nr:MAG: peptidase M19 [Betaproteobacteria bacterium HGW-Betaproteobacteria-9]